MLEFIICNLPVYLRSEDRYYKEHDDLENNLINSYKRYLEESKDKDYIAVPKDPDKQLEKIRIRNEWPNWKYNDIIGFLQIDAFKDMFKADLWMIEAKRFNRNPLNKRKSRIELIDKITEDWFGDSASNEAIREAFINVLNDSEEHLKKKNKYLFTKEVWMIAEFLDFRNLISSMTER